MLFWLKKDFRALKLSVIMQSKISPDKKIIVLYHGDCPDGFGAAWAAWKKFGDEAQYVSLNHQLPPPDGLKDKTLYFLDFAYKPESMKDLVNSNEAVIVIDHHVSAAEAIKIANDYLYDNNHSGAILSWKYFHGEDKIPNLLKYIEDRDLWKFNLPETAALCASVDSFDFDFKTWDKLVAELEDPDGLKEHRNKGEFIVKYEEEVIKHLIEKNAYLVDFEGQETYCVNAPHMFASMIGTMLYKKKPPIAIIWSESHDGIAVSLRSDGSVDVSKIAEKYGGGGHKSAAGFSLEYCFHFPWKKKNKE